ncbi:MAG TPA: cell division protein FtsK [Lachnospiraceae bacterium]|nr:cell division protein FtsK [Lachnospiraceae bacterium]
MATKKTNGRKRTGSRKTSAASGRKKNSTGKSGSARRKNTARPVESTGIAGDILLLTVFLLSVLLFLFNIGIGGPAGNAISDVLFGIFGLTAYVVPFYLFFAVAFYMANRKNALIIRKMTGLLMLLIFVCAIVHLIVVREYSRSIPISDYYYMSADEHSGGGIIGGAVVRLFAFGFSNVIAWILCIFGLILSLIILTQKPLVTKLGIKTKRTAERVRRNRKARSADEDDEDDDPEDEEDIESQRAMRRSSYRRWLPLFNLKGSHDKEKTREEKVTEAGSHVADEAFEEVKRPAQDKSAVNKETVKKKSASARKEAEKKEKSKASAEKSGTASGASDSSQVPSFLMNVMTSSGTDHKVEKEISESLKADSDDAEENAPSIKIEGAFDDSVQVSGAEADATGKEQTSPKRGTVKKTRSSEEEIVSNIKNVSNEISRQEKDAAQYIMPSPELLTRGKVQQGDSKQHLIETAQKLEQIFRDFGVNVHVNNVSRGPTVTRYELTPEQGVKVSKIVSLSDDIKLNLAASEIRIEAPIPGKAAVGIEVPNKESSVVAFRDLVESGEFRKSKAPLTFAVGKDIAGKPVVSDIAKMPHLLIAGATGSGKSVCINTLIMSILMKSTPDEVRMLMIDPKVVELKIYDGIPHLLIPVVTDPKKAAGALNWAVQEMNDRYNKFAEYTGVRDLKSYNKRIEKINEALPPDEQLKKLPQILIVVDELADLMMVAPGEVEDAICRLAQLARAAGLHLVIATQRPSVNVVTGLIKANMPSRIALAVSSGVDSRTIIDMNGAEKLLGHGDMLFAPQGYPKPARVQGAYISDDDISRVVKFLTQQKSEEVYNQDVEDQITKTINNSAPGSPAKDSGRDEYFVDAGRFIIEKDKASIGMLQRMFKIGFNRAARIMDQLCEAGVVGPEEGTKPRKIIMDAETFEATFGEQG